MKRQENRAVIAWRGAASAGLVSSADRAYENSVPVQHSDLWTKCPEDVATLSEKQTHFSFLKLKWAESHFRGFSALIAWQQKAGGSVNGGAFMRRSSCR